MAAADQGSRLPGAVPDLARSGIEFQAARALTEFLNGLQDLAGAIMGSEGLRIGVGATKGDLLAFDGEQWQAISAGDDGEVLTADGDETLGVKWAPAVTVTTVEVDLGALARSGRFTITDALITATSKVQAWQAPGPYTGKGTRADEAELAPVRVVAVAPAAGSAVVYWRAEGYVIARPQSYDASHGGGRQVAVPAVQQAVHNIDTRLQAVAIGKVGGNVKFSYSVF